MSSAGECPGCRAELREGARYCVKCGVEVRPPCPACEAAPRWLATLRRENSPWCPDCGSLLNACEQCGRWLLTSQTTCPDPQCSARVLPFLPQHTGRTPEGRGEGVRWRWPEQWERHHPQYQLPTERIWKANGAVHAAFVAHGRAHVWEDTTLLALPVQDWSAQPVWRCPFGPSGRPASGIAFTERIAVAGAGAVAALGGRFVVADLGGSGSILPLEGGVPLAQAAGPGWWVGWSEEAGTPTLRTAAIGDTWDALQPEPVETLAEAAPMSGGRIVLSAGIAYWPARDGSVWRVVLESGTVERVLAPQEGLRVIWAEPDGPRTARESLGQISLLLAAPEAGRTALNVPAGPGPLREALAAEGMVVVVGERVVSFEARTGGRQHEARRRDGRWVEGALVPGPSGEAEPRLLELTQDSRFAELVGLRLASGAEEVLWRTPDVEGLALLPVGNALYVAHTGGLTRLE